MRDLLLEESYDYNSSLRSLHIASGGRTVEGRAGTPAEARVVVERLRVAAKSAAKACSFTGGIPVLMADGTKKPIKDVKIGDRAIATDWRDPNGTFWCIFRDGSTVPK